MSDSGSCRKRDQSRPESGLASCSTRPGGDRKTKVVVLGQHGTRARTRGPSMLHITETSRRTGGLPDTQGRGPSKRLTSSQDDNLPGQLDGMSSSCSTRRWQQFRLKPSQLCFFCRGRYACPANSLHCDVPGITGRGAQDVSKLAALPSAHGVRSRCQDLTE